LICSSSDTKLVRRSASAQSLQAGKNTDLSAPSDHGTTINIRIKVS